MFSVRVDRWTVALTAAFGGYLVVAARVSGTPPTENQRAAPTEDSASLQRAAEDAYVYGYPMMVLDMTKQVMAKGITNHFGYVPKPPAADFNTVVRPNVDTLYTSTFLDLAAEPVVVHVPDTHRRYYVMEAVDAYTNVFASPGKRTTGTAAQDFVFVGPGWQGTLPPGLKRIDSPTRAAWVLSRTQLNGPEDVASVAALQRQYTMAPLSEWPAHPVAAAPIVAPAPGTVAPEVQVEKMDAEVYFQKLGDLMLVSPGPEADLPAVQRFAEIGLIPGQTFHSGASHEVLQSAKERALARIKTQSANLGKPINGWRLPVEGLGAYGTDYDQRAAVCYFGLGANLPADAVYPPAHEDSAGQPPGIRPVK